MSYLAALLIFAAVATATWFVGVAVYQSLFPAPDLRTDPGFVGASSASILLVTLASLVPFPIGYFLSLGVWAFAAWGILGLPSTRGGVLFASLAVLSFLSRLAILGALNL